MRGGQRWLGKEVRILMGAVRRSPGFQQLMSSSNQHNEGLWLDIGIQLAEMGYQRSPEQCRAKWKWLKQKFFREMRGARQRRSFPYYTKIRKYWEKAGSPPFGDRRDPDRSFGSPAVSLHASVNDSNSPPPFMEEEITEREADVSNRVVQTEPQETMSSRRSEDTVIPDSANREIVSSDDEQPCTSNKQGGSEESLMQSLLRNVENLMNPILKNQENFMTSVLKNREKQDNFARDIASILGQMMEQQILLLRKFSMNNVAQGAQ